MGGGASRYKAPRTTANRQQCQMYSNTETSVMTSPMTFTSLMVSEDGAWLQVALGTQQWTKGSQTHDYKDRLVSGVPSQLPLRQSTRTRKHCSDLSMQMLDQFYSMVGPCQRLWLSHDCQHLGLWDALASESHQNLYGEPLCCWKTTPAPSQA